MSVREHYYVGAYMKVPDVFKEVPVFGYCCGVHGYQSYEAGYCRKCGSKLINKQYKTTKEYKQSIDKFENVMQSVSNGSYDICFSNQVNDGMIGDIDSDGLESSYDLLNIINLDDVDCKALIEDFKNAEAHKEYIEYLESQGIDISFHCGIVKYFS